MSYDTPPAHLAALNARLMKLERSDELVVRRRTTMALVVVGQMLPEGAVKGGSAMALRYGFMTRFTRDLDVARVHDIEQFRSDFEERLMAGWEGFTGRLVEREPPQPAGVPAEYVMQPFDIKLEYRGRPWCTVTFELGHNEIGDAEQPELRLAAEVAGMFTELGFPEPRPVPVMPADHQIAQKLHACSSTGSERARDLVDLQLLDAREDLDLAIVRTTCERLFQYRNAQAWPPVITAGPGWDTLYAEAESGLDVAPGVESAIEQVSALISRIAEA